MKKKILIVLISICIILTIVIFYFNRNYKILRTNDLENGYYKIGIIDGSLSQKHNNIINRTNIYSDLCTHGDSILSFLELYMPKFEFYYYDASINEKICSQGIINGLNWMIDNGIDYVSISVTSKFYSNELESWILNNNKRIKIYASYSNLISTKDYPAQYKNVIGIGTDSRILYKDIDIKEKTNKIILFSNGIHIYTGNSYLTPVEMINSIKCLK